MPLSYAQRRLWFLERLEGGEEGRSGGGTYAIPLAVRLSGGLDRAALEDALNDLVGRHESLRTVFPESAGVPRQEIVAASSARIELEITSITEDELAAALGAAVNRGFDLARELPLRAHLYALADTSDHVLLLVLHHIAGDGWSLRPLLRDLGALYRARLEGHRRRCRRFRFSTPTTRCGSRRCWARKQKRPARSRGSSRSGRTL